MSGAKRPGKARFLDLKRFPMDLGRGVASPMLLFFRIKKRYADPENRWRERGGAILAANHVSFRDPFLLGCAFWKRRVFFLTGEVIMNTPLRDLLLRGMGCVKIRRGDAMDSAPIGKVAELLRTGYCCAVFPQGEIRRSGEVGDIKGGAVLLAAQTGVPVIPLYSRRRERWWQRQTIIIGEPLYCRSASGRQIPTRVEIDALTEELKDRLLQCRVVYDRGQKN